MNGNDIIVYTYQGSYWVAVAYTKSDDLKTDCEMLKKASESQQEWDEYEAGRKSWGINTSWLVSAVADIRKVLTIGTKVKIHMGSRNGYNASTGVTGFAFVKSCEVRATRGTLCQGSFVFQGTGPLT